MKPSDVDSLEPLPNDVIMNRELDELNEVLYKHKRMTIVPMWSHLIEKAT